MSDWKNVHAVKLVVSVTAILISEEVNPEATETRPADGFQDRNRG